MSRFPSIFFSHGAPDLILSDEPARYFIEGLGHDLPRPRAVLMISAHWQAAVPTLATAPAPETIHDFYGFPAPLYELRYPAQTDGDLASRVEELFSAAGVTSAKDDRRGYDHGAWVPMMLSYPNADVPMVQMSLIRQGSAREHFEMGQALAPLRDEGILIIGSGGHVHNLKDFRTASGGPADWAMDFDRWLDGALMGRALETLLSFPDAPPSAAKAHPTDEHLMPLYVAMGAGWEDGKTRRLHHSFSHGSIGMSAYAFGGT